MKNHVEVALRSLLAWLFFVGFAISVAAADSPAGAPLAPGQFLKDWLLLKPIPVTGPSNQAPDDAARKQALAQDWLQSAGGEAQFQPRPGMKITIAGHPLKWQPMKLRTGLADLLVNGHPMDNSLAYAFTEFDLPQAGAGFLGLGSDDEAKIWLNGKLVHEHLTSRPLKADDDLVPVNFQPGRNRLMFKVENEGGGWGFACRILNEDQGRGLKLTHENRQNPNSSALTDDDITTILHDFIDRDKMAVGLVVGLVDEHGPRIVSHGRLGNGTDANVDGDTLFEIGSITKVFTALLLQDMIERGEMKLDDPVQKYLPASIQMPTCQGKQITLLHLATHTSGLPRERGDLHPKNWRNPEADYTVEQLADSLSHYQLTRAPGARSQYSNLGVSLLAYAIALKAGQDYETLVQERICRPLGMDSTCIAVPSALKARLAQGYARPGRPVPDADFSFLCGAGSLRSTANDLLKFISAYAGITASPLRSLMEKAEALHPLESGARMRLVWPGDGDFFEHGGLTFGFASELAFDRKTRRGIVILSNCASSMGLIPRRFFQGLRNGLSPRPAQTAPVRPALYDLVAGQYRSDAGGICVVRHEGSRLLVHWLGPPGQRVRGVSFEVFPQSDSVFYNKLSDIEAIFTRTDGGAGSKMILVAPGAVVEATRISDQVPAIPNPIQVDPKIYDAFAGQYRHTLLFGLLRIGPTLSVRREDDELGGHLMGYMQMKYLQALFRGPDVSTLGGVNAAGLEFFPESETTYCPMDSAGDVQLTFLRNRNGKATGLTASFKGMTFTASRISSKPTDWK
jgi:serine-type D-Ala-D-Ala carboxypeptidase/endopeptidase